MICFALAAILSRQNDVLELLRAQRASGAGGSWAASVGGVSSGAAGDVVVVVSPTKYGAPGDLVRARLAERALALEGYEDLPSALAEEWKRFANVALAGESLHASVDEAQAYAKASGFKAYAYPVTRQEFRRQLADLLPSVRG